MAGEISGLYGSVNQANATVDKTAAATFIPNL